MIVCNVLISKNTNNTVNNLL